MNVVVVVVVVVVVNVFPDPESLIQV